MPNYSDLDFTQKSQFNEAKLRGAYLSMACDIEFMLVDVICICLVKDEADRKAVKVILLENAMMSKKIALTRKAIKRYNLGYYDGYKGCLNTFEEFNEWRNMFAHSRIKGDPEERDLSFMIFEYIKKGEIVEQREEFDPLYKKLLGYAAAIMKFSELIVIIYTERGQAT